MPAMWLGTFMCDSPVTVESTAALEIIRFAAENPRDYVVLVEWRWDVACSDSERL